MKKLTQKIWVEGILFETKQISRNNCLQNYVSRLGAIIATLKSEGYEFEAEYIEYQTLMGWSGKDYVYTVTKFPKEIQEKIDARNK